MHFCSGVIASWHCRHSKAWLLPVASSGHPKGSGAFGQEPGGRDQYACVCVISRPDRVCPAAAAGLCCFWLWALVTDVTARGAESFRVSWVRSSERNCQLIRGLRSGLEALLCVVHSGSHTPQQGTGLLFLHVFANTCFLVFFILTVAILMVVKWYLIGALYSVVDQKNSICSLSLEYS